MLLQPVRHLAITLAAADWGIWVGGFAYVSVPLLIFATWQVEQCRQWELTLLFVPTFFIVSFYPLISFNFPRYQTAAVHGLALAHAN